MNHEDDDNRELEEIPPDEPVGKVKVSFDVPVPTVEQVGGEIARQILASNYKSKEELTKLAGAAIHATINSIIAEQVVGIVNELLTKPIRPTDQFGNPIGEPTTLQGALAHRVTAWCTDTVTSEGKPTKPDSYNSTAPRMNWMLGQIVNGELKKQVDAEVAKIIAQLKGSATNLIAKQIADKISGLVIK